MAQNDVKIQRFFNGAELKEETKEYAVFAVRKGFLLAPTFERQEKRLIISYDKFYEDIFVTDFDKVLQKINDFLLEEIGEKQIIDLRWYVDDLEPKAKKIIMQNKLINAQFDSE